MTTVVEAIQGFREDLTLSQSAQTVQTHSQGVARLGEFLATQNILPDSPVSLLTVDYAIGCAQWLSQARGASGERPGRIGKATLHTYLAGISRFYTYLLRERLIEVSASDPIRLREGLHGFRHGYRQRLPKLPPEEAVTALLATARRVKPEPKKPRLELARLRNIAMIEALRASGMRVGELVGLKRDDLDYRQHSARVTGKGGKQRIVFFDDAAWNSIQAYLKERSDGERGRALYQLPLFARHDRRASKRVLPMTTHGVRLAFNQLVGAAQIEIGMTPHSLRHAFATKMLDVTGDLAIVQDMLGHSSPTTTRIYAKISNKKIRDAHRAAFGYRGNESPAK